MKIITIVLCLVLSGCVTSQPVALPDGSRGLALNCSGGEHTITDCMNEAGKECGGPYTIINRDDSSPSAAAMPVGQSAIFLTARSRILIVKCGK